MVIHMFKDQRKMIPMAEKVTLVAFDSIIRINYNVLYAFRISSSATYVYMDRLIKDPSSCLVLT